MADTHFTKTALLLHLNGSNGSTTITDSSSFGRTVTATNGAALSTAQSKFGGSSAYFDGVNDTIRAADSADFTPGSGDFTWECWAYFTTTSGNKTLISCWNNWTLYAASNGGLYVYGTNTGGNILGGTSYALNSWHHYAISRADGTLRLFIDGTQVDSVSYTTNIPSTDLWVGCNTTSDAPMLGYLDEVRITMGYARYRESFTAPTVPFPDSQEPAAAPTYDADLGKVSLLLHGEGANGATVVTDSSQTGKAGKIFGDVRISTGASKAGDSSLYFGGSGTCVLYPYSADMQLTGDFTIELWVRPTVNSNTMILNMGGGSGIAWASYELVWQSGSVNFAGSSANSGYDIGSESGSTGSLGSVGLNVWTHIAVTCQGNVYRGFVNGVQTYTQTLALHPLDTGSRGLSLGSNFTTTWGVGTPTSCFPGYLDEVRITKGLARYTANFTPSVEPFPEYVGVISGKTKNSLGVLASCRIQALRQLTGALATDIYSAPGTGEFLVPTKFMDEHTLVFYPSAGEVRTLPAKVLRGILPVPP